MYNRFNGPPNPRPAATPGTPATRPTANPYAAFPQGTRPPTPQAPPAQAPQGASGPYAPFPQGTRPVPPRPGADVPHYNNIPPAAPHYNTIPSTGPTAPPRPPRTDLTQNANGPQPPANAPQTTQYANVPQLPANAPQTAQYPNIPQPRPTAPQSAQYANIPQPPPTPPTIAGPAGQPAMPGNAVGKTAVPQPNGRSAQPPSTGRTQPDAEPQAFPRQKPYMARIPDFSNLPQPANKAPKNAAPGVPPSAPAQQQRPANDQHSAPAQGANPYGKLSAAIMNQAAYNLKNGGPAKESPYGSMHPVSGISAPGKAESPYGKMMPVEKTSPNAPGSQKPTRRM